MGQSKALLQVGNHLPQAALRSGALRGGKGNRTWSRSGQGKGEGGARLEVQQPRAGPRLASGAALCSKPEAGFARGAAATAGAHCVLSTTCTPPTTHMSFNPPQASNTRSDRRCRGRRRAPQTWRWPAPPPGAACARWRGRRSAAGWGAAAWWRRRRRLESARNLRQQAGQGGRQARLVGEAAAMQLGPARRRRALSRDAPSRRRARPCTAPPQCQDLVLRPNLTSRSPASP